MNKLELKKEDGDKKERQGVFLAKTFKTMSIGMAILAFTGPIKDTKASKQMDIMKSSDSGNSDIRPPSWLMPQIIKKENEPQRIWQSPDMRRIPFIEGVDEHGKPRFNIWSLIALLQAEVPYIDKAEGKITIQLPFEYARLFAADEKSGRSVRPEDQERIKTFLDNEFNKRFEEILYGWDWSKRVYQHSQESVPENVRIKSIEVTGTASPEGPSSKGSHTISPDEIDRENLELAFKRGQVGLSLAKEWLEKTGINLKQLEETATKIQAKEIQFNARELSELRIISQKMEGHNDLEKIYNLIKAYNSNTIKDQNIIDTLDQAVGRKRMVEVTINYEGDKRKRILIPIPLLPIIIGITLPGLIRAVRKRNEVENKASEINSSIQTTELPLENFSEYQDMKERTIVDDLGMFFDRKEVIERGLDYRKLAFDAQKTFDDFGDNAERELYLTGEILEAWKTHDTKCRQEAGFAPDRLETGLDYENQPYQIRWAKMHAKALLELIEEKQRSGRDYKDILGDNISKILKRGDAR